MTRVIFIGAGQSNMVGAEMPSPAPTYANASKIFVMPQPWNAAWSQPVDHTNPGGGSWVQASDPLHSWPGSGVGPLMALADRYLTVKNDTNLEVGLLPCGWSGSTIEYNGQTNLQWGRSYHNAQAWGAMIARIHASESWGTIKGFVWAQGESDVDYPPNSPPIFPNYFESLYSLIRDVRYEVNNLRLPVIIHRLGANNGSNQNWQALSDMQALYINGCDPMVRCVTPPNLATIGDGVHLTAAAQIALGCADADELIAMGA